MLSHTEIAHEIAKFVRAHGRLSVCETTVGVPSSKFPKEISLKAPTGTALKRLDGTPEFAQWRESWVAAEWPVTSGFYVSVDLVRINRTDKNVPKSVGLKTLDGALDLLMFLDVEVWAATNQIVELWRDQVGELLGAVKDARKRYRQSLDATDLAHRVAKLLPAASTVKLPKPVTGPSVAKAVNVGSATGNSRVTELVAVLGYLAEQEQPPSGQTLRQVSIPGVQGKWLENNQKLLASVLGTDPFTEVAERVQRVQLTYIDPGHLAQPNARQYDVYVRDQKHQLEYAPRIVLICENNECADRFPPVPGAIAVRGEGAAVAGLLRGSQLLESAEHLVYWGDIDERGLSILAMLRRDLRGNGYPQLRSILMDYPAYQKYSTDKGTNKNVNGEDIKVENLKAEGLDLHEKRAFDVVTGPNPAPYRRIEQERIPLDDAREALRALIGETAGSGQSSE